MEVKQLFLMDTRKTCVTFAIHQASTPDLLIFLIAGSGKSVLWFATPPNLSFLVKLTVTFQLLDHTSYHSLARCWESLDGLLLFRFQGP